MCTSRLATVSGAGTMRVLWQEMTKKPPLSLLESSVEVTLCAEVHRFSPR